MSKLLKSRKFLLLLLDTVIAATAFAVSQFASPEVADKIMVVVALLQPVFVAIILAIAVEDSAALKAGSHPNQRG